MRVALAAIALAGAAVTAAAIQKLTPAEVAAKMSGTWVLNRELTTGFNAPRAARRAGAAAARGFRLHRAPRNAAPARTVNGFGRQRHDRRRAAAMMAMRELQQIAELVSIKATREPRSPSRTLAASAAISSTARASRCRRWYRRQRQVTLGQGNRQAGVLDYVQQADTDLERRRERAPGHDGQGREPAPANAGPEGGFRPEAAVEASQRRLKPLETCFGVPEPDDSLIYDDRSNFCLWRVALVKRIGMGIVGAGFVGPHHIDAVRRLGFVDVFAIAGSSDARRRRRRRPSACRRPTAATRRCSRIPAIQVVHNATPNYLHYPVNAAAIAKGKHVVSDKPLAMTAAEARSSSIRRRRPASSTPSPSIIAAIRSCSRRAWIARGEIGKPHFLVGHYLQDWLLKDTDYSWRLEPDKGGASSALGDIGSHWCDLVQHITGRQITECSATSLPWSRSARSRRDRARLLPRRAPTSNWKASTSRSRTSRRCMLRFDNGARGSFSVGQVCAGHKNDLMLEVCGAKRRCAGARNTRTSCGLATATRRTRYCRRIRTH